MGHNIDERVENAIINLAKEHSIEKVILFGSRARGTNHDRSDIDLAVSGGNVCDFRLDVDEKTPTLLMFDVVDLDRRINAALKKEIDRDGVILYEKV